MAVRNVSSSPIRGYTCGHVGCCDSSRNKHAAKHFAATAHPINVSYERGEEGVGATSIKATSSRPRWSSRSENRSRPHSRVLPGVPQESSGERHERNELTS